MTKTKDMNMKSDMVRQGLDLEKEAKPMFDYTCPKCKQDIKVQEGKNKCTVCGYIIDFVPNPE